MREMIRMDRRALLAQAMLLVGAGVAASACTTIPALASGESTSMSEGQMATLVAVADTIVPKGDTVGALDVGVPGLFAGLMDNWAAPETRTILLGVLERIEDLPGNGRSFADLHSDEQKMLLQRFDTAALTPSGARGSPFGPAPATDPAYQRLKQLILTLYYLSQPALTQELAYTHVPGRWDPSVPVTSATRPQGGPGMF